MQKTWGRKQIRVKRINYVIHELDKIIQYEGIPSRIFLHLSLAQIVVRNRNEVLEILKLHFPECRNAKQFGREVVFNMIVLSGPKIQSNENQKNNETWKKEKKRANETWTYQLMSFMAFRKIAMQFLGSTTMQSTEICQSLSRERCLFMCLHQAVNRWFPLHTKNILPTRWARLESFWSMKSNSSLASCHNEL